jgi:uracil-DNA glycosylase
MDNFAKIKQAIMDDPFNAAYTERGIEPLYNVTKEARIVIVGQAPGRVAEETRLFWNDLSGDRLREWMDVSREIFYESNLIAQIPMDFYYPGKGKSGDAPPRKGFAEKWHPQLLAEMPNVKLTMLVGTYSQGYYLGKRRGKNLTETVQNFEQYLPDYFPLVHPSPLNFRWQNKNPWFERDVLPVLKELVHEII